MPDAVDPLYVAWSTDNPQFLEGYPVDDGLTPEELAAVVELVRVAIKTRYRYQQLLKFVRLQTQALKAIEDHDGYTNRDRERIINNMLVVVGNGVGDIPVRKSDAK